MSKTTQFYNVNLILPDEWTCAIFGRYRNIITNNLNFLRVGMLWIIHHHNIMYIQYNMVTERRLL